MFGAKTMTVFDDEPSVGSEVRMSGGVVPEGYRAYPPRVNMYAETVGRAIAAGCGALPALVCDGGTLTYDELDRTAGRVAAGLLAAGLAEGDAILLRSDNRPAYPILALAAFRIGAVAVMSSSLLLQDDVAYLLENSGARFAAAPAGLAAPLKALLDAGALDRLVIVDGPAEGESEGVISYDSFETCTPIDWIADTEAMAPAFMVYSSGTTGRPKGILHGHRWAIALGDPVVLHNEYAPGDVTMTSGEFSFMGTFGNNFIGPLRAGATVALFFGRANPRSVLEAVARFKVNKFLSVPTFYRRVLSEPGVEDGVDLSEVSFVTSAGESLGSTVPEQWSQRFDFPIYEIYGVSEVMTCMANTAYNEVKWGSMGKALPGYRMTIMNDRLEPVAVGESGRLMIHRDDPGMFLCYYRQWEKWQAAHKGEWYDTGDVMRQDEDGYYYYLGRKDDLFKSRGYFISPQEVENALLKHEAVAEAAVIGIPDDAYGNRIAAFARLAGGNAPSDELKGDILKDARRRLAPYKVPKSLEFLDEVPKNPVGKILRSALATD